MRFGVVILAAGASSRMGQPKLLLPWGDKTILGHLMAQWTALGAAQIAVVIAPNSPLEGHPGDVERILNPNPELGMFSSVQWAAKWTGWKDDLTHLVITLGDQPHVRIETLSAVIDFAAANPELICQPSRQGRGRHPVIMPRLFFAQLALATEPNLKEFLRARESQRKLLELDDDALDLDIDTPEDYQNALPFKPLL